MTIAGVIALLQSASLLLTAVQANTNLPVEFRNHAQSVAMTAIQEGNRILASQNSHIVKDLSGNIIGATVSEPAKSVTSNSQTSAEIDNPENIAYWLYRYPNASTNSIIALYSKFVNADKIKSIDQQIESLQHQNREIETQLNALQNDDKKGVELSIKRLGISNQLSLLVLQKNNLMGVETKLPDSFFRTSSQTAARTSRPSYCQLSPMGNSALYLQCF